MLQRSNRLACGSPAYPTDDVNASISIYTDVAFVKIILLGRHFLEGGADRRVLTSEVVAKKHAKEMGLHARGSVDVADEKTWRGQQEKFPVRERLS